METIAFLQSAASPLLDRVALAITNLGSEYAYITLLMIAYLGFDPMRGRRLGMYFLVSVYVNALLKEFFATPRPFVIDPDILRPGAVAETAPGNGFPSGHAQGAATYWGIAALYVGRPWFWVLAAVLTVAISLTRLYLGVHLPIDIVGGLALGVLAVLLVPFLDRQRIALPAGLQIVLALALPLLLLVIYPVESGEVYLGGLAGFMLAPFIMRPRAGVSPLGLALRCLLGLLLAGLLLVTSSLLLPDTLKELPPVGYLRYLLVALAGLVGAPWLLELVGGRREPKTRPDA